MYPALLGKRKSRILTLWIRAVLLLIVALAMQASAQKTTVTVTAKTGPKVHQNEIKYVSPVSGKEMYEAYCASCHGANGNGNSPAATVLVPRPTDLTLLSCRNGGGFPRDRVRYLLTDLDLYSEHGAKDMPSWGPALKSLQKSHPELVGLRVQNLMAYLETMQAPPDNAGTDPGSSAKHR
jgi:mono/diheme cytochrome c family protein